MMKKHTIQQLVVDVEGVVFNKSQSQRQSENETETQYSVYIPKLRTCSTVITTEALEEYSLYSFNLYFIRDEHSVKQKIRLELKRSNQY